MASETAKPEAKRNWNSLCDWGEKLLGIAGKASDMATRLAPYLPKIEALLSPA